MQSRRSAEEVGTGPAKVAIYGRFVVGNHDKENSMRKNNEDKDERLK